MRRRRRTIKDETAAIIAMSPVMTKEASAKRLEEKSRQILAVLHATTTSGEIDLWKLRGLAITEGGLVNGTGKPWTCA
jgi:hypothetical protein